MSHKLTLIAIALIVLTFMIIIWASFTKEQRVLKYSRKPGRRIWYKVMTYHPLTLVIVIVLYVSTFVGVMKLRGYSVFDPSNNYQMIEVISWTLGYYLVVIGFWIIGLQQRVDLMSVRKFNRTFSKVFKSNETLYNANSFNYNFRCKITLLQIQLYSKERITSKMALDAREMFKDKFHVKYFNPKKLKLAKKKALKLSKKYKKENAKRENKNSY